MRVGQNIKTIAEAKRISIKELSRMVGIPYTTLYNMVNRNTDRFDLGLLEDIAHSLDVPIGALLESGELSLAEILGIILHPATEPSPRTAHPNTNPKIHKIPAIIFLTTLKRTILFRLI
jgi:transcriptional regulator with XRE-family HTH domain